MIGPPALLGAPSAIGLSPRSDGGPRGVDLAPAALRAEGIAARFGARDRGDVLDPQLMPAVDSSEPGGLTYESLAELLRPLVAAPQALGLQVTIYDPSLDGGEGARPLTDLVVAAFR